MKTATASFVGVCGLVLLMVPGVWADTFGAGANQFSIEFVTISGSTNPASGSGVVGNDFRMGMYEITNEQWTKFVANLGLPVTGDPTAAYDNNAWFTGADLPANRISWYEAAQFVNWLNIIEGYQAAYNFTGLQGTAGYTLNVWGAGEADGTNLYRHKEAMYFLPSLDEWVKAAYWNGTSMQNYATPSGAAPTTTGWRYLKTVLDGPWAVGSGDEELNGTYDMMGNGGEWLETPYGGTYTPTANRWKYGGAYDSSVVGQLAFGALANANPSDESFGSGFRVASKVPEPSSVTFLLLAGGLVFLRTRR